MIHSVVWITTKAKSINENIQIGCVYMPTEASPYFNIGFDRFDRLEESVLSRSKTGHVILCGDLNARTGELVDYIPNDYVNDTN